MKKRFSLAIMALCAMMGFSSLYAQDTDPDPYQNEISKSGFASFNPAGNFSVQAKLTAGQSFEARNAAGKGFVYKAEKPGMYSFLADVTAGTLKVYWGPTLEAELSITTSENYLSLGGEDLVTAEEQNSTSRKGIYSTKNLLKNPGFESYTPYDGYGVEDQRGRPDDWEVLPASDVATNCRNIEVQNNAGYANIRSLVEGSWVYMLHNSATPLWQKLSTTLKPSTWYKVHYRQLAHKDTSPAAPYTHYISSDSVSLGTDSANLIASYAYTSAAQGFGNYIDVAYLFKTPASVPGNLYFVIRRGATGCINHFDRMTMQEMSADDLYRYYGIVSTVDKVTWQEGLQVPVGGSNDTYEDVTATYFVNPSFETTPINETVAEGSNSDTGGNGPIYQPQGWTVTYSTIKAPDTWDQGLVTSGQSALDKSKNPPVSSDTQLRASEGEYFYYFRTRWTKKQDFEISQTLKDVPAGRYNLIVNAAADPENPAMIKVSGPVIKSLAVNEFAMKSYTMEVNIMNPSDLNVSVYLQQQTETTTDNNPAFQARLGLDNFLLIYRGEPIEEALLEEYKATVDAAMTAITEYDGSVPSGVWADWQNAVELTNEAYIDGTVANWKAAADMYTKALEGAKASVSLYERLYDMYEVTIPTEIANTQLSGAAAYESANNAVIVYLSPESPTLYYAVDLEKAIEDLLVARRAYYSTAFNDATVSVEKEVTYAVDYAPYFTKYGGDISLVSDRTKGNWLTNNIPVTSGQYKLHTVTGKNCWNNWENNFTSMDLYQEIANLPAGMYRVQALTATNGVPNDQHAYITTIAGTSNSPAATTQYTAGGSFENEAEWEGPLSTEKVYLPEGATLRIGFASTGAGGTSGWFCATGFELFYSKAAPGAAKEALDLKVAEAEMLLDTAGVKIMGVEKAALNKEVAAAKAANTDEAIAAVFQPLYMAIVNAGVSVTTYNTMSPVLEGVKTLLADTSYPEEARTALSKVITEQEGVLAAASTATTDIPAVKKALENARTLYLVSKIEKEIPDDVSSTNPYNLTSLIVNPTIEGEGNETLPEGWTISRVDAGNNNYTTTGQHYSGSLENRYLDGWNGTAGKLKFTATQTLSVPNGTYRLVCAARTSGTGSYVYAYGHKPNVVEITNAGAEAGAIWEAAEEGSDEKLANEEKGWGWAYYTVDNINVDENILVVGVTCDAAVSSGNAWTGTWFSADDFKLYCISKEFGTSIEDVNADDDPLNVYVENGYIIVEGVDNFTVVTLSGASVSSDSQLAPGFYIVTAAGKTAKVVVK